MIISKIVSWIHTLLYQYGDNDIENCISNRYIDGSSDSETEEV